MHHYRFFCSGRLVPSINSLILLSEFSLNYHDIDQAIQLIKSTSLGAWLVKIDITSAFKIMPISPMRNDFLIISPNLSPPATHLSTVQKMFSELRIPIASEITEGPPPPPSSFSEFASTVKFQALLSKDKIDRIISVVYNHTLAMEICKCNLLSLLGQLNFAMRIVPQGRPFISHLLSLASSVRGLNDLVTLNNLCIANLNLWPLFLNQWNCHSFFYDTHIASVADMHLFNDAAPSVGFGGSFKVAVSLPPSLPNS